MENGSARITLALVRGGDSLGLRIRSRRSRWILASRAAP
jgi:hypothetical protein